MPLEAEKYLYDISQAANLIDQFTTGKDFASYEGDAMVRSAVERQFEIVGEARSTDEAGARPRRAGERIPSHHRVSQHSHSWLCPGRQPARLGHRADVAAHTAH